MEQSPNSLPEIPDDPTVIGATYKGIDKNNIEINFFYKNGVKQKVWEGPDIIMNDSAVFSLDANSQPRLLDLTGRSGKEARVKLKDHSISANQVDIPIDYSQRGKIEKRAHESFERAYYRKAIKQYLYPVPGGDESLSKDQFKIASKEEMYSSLSHSLHHWESKVKRYSDLVDFSQKWEEKIQDLSQNIDRTKAKLNHLDSEIDSLIRDIYKDPIDRKTLQNSINKLENDPRSFGKVKDSYNRSFVDKAIGKENSQLLTKSKELSEHLNWRAQTKGTLLNLQERGKSAVQELSFSKIETNLTMKMGMRHHPITVDTSLSEVSNRLKKHSNWAKRRLNFAKSKVTAIKPVLSKHLSSELSKKGAKLLNSKVSSIAKMVAKASPKAKALKMVLKQVKKMTKAHALER